MKRRLRMNMDVTSIVGAGGALLAGLSGSLHCALMCGPLACAGLPRTDERTSRFGAVLGYQGGRVIAYTAVGALLGLIGNGVVWTLASTVQPYLPWVMAAALTFTALDLGKRLPPIPGLSHLARALSRRGARLSPTMRASLLGAATPFLPCGLLYGVMVAAIATGSPAGGALVMGGFSLGGVPALTATQLQGRWLTSRPRFSFAFRRAFPLLAALVLVWRALMVPQPAHAAAVSNAATAPLPPVHHCH